MNLTSNRRLAAFIKEQDPEGEVYPLSLWLEKLYKEECKKDQNLPRLMEMHEENHLWEKIIKESDAGSSLLNVFNTAKLVQDAWRLIHQWQVKENDNILQSDDELTFNNWISAFIKVCHEKSLIDSASYIFTLKNIIEKRKDFNFPKEITLIGFEELPPQLEALLQCFMQKGVNIQKKSLVTEKGNVKRLPLKDFEEELRMAARYAKLLQTENDQHRIAIIVPDLEQQRSKVVRIFNEILTQDSFNISAPVSLISYPLIEAALLGIELLNKEVSIEKMSQFLRSPFFRHSENETDAMIVLDLLLRDRAESFISIEALIFKLNAWVNVPPKISNYIKNLSSRLQKLLTLRQKVSKLSTAFTWGSIFDETLEILGWPGNRTFISEEFQIRHQWEKLLFAYKEMDGFLGPHNFFSAYSQLNRLANDISFLPQSPLANVQVLGMLEALGMPFDTLWVIGLHRDIWPNDPMPNPFIAWQIQKRLNLPRSSHARELAMAKKFTERLCQGAKNVIFSYPLLIEENKTYVSALLQDFPEVNLSSLGLKETLSDFERKAKIEPYIPQKDEKGPQFATMEKSSRGTRLLKLQSECPFRAFAETRLQALPIPLIRSGLALSEKGEIIHEVLQLFWEDLSNQNQLKTLTSDEIQIKISTAVDTILEIWKRNYPKMLTPNYLELEKERICEIILKFIELEKHRPYFEVIEKEKKKTVLLHDIPFKIRIDRIDRLENGQEILIDYKIGACSINHWFGQRPKDPQLPFYCITHDSKPSGILFAILKSGEVKYQGIVDEKMEMKGLKTVKEVKNLGAEESFEAQQVRWKDDLEALAREFSTGIAKVEPKENESTCRTCSLQPLCKIHITS